MKGIIFKAVIIFFTMFCSFCFVFADDEINAEEKVEEISGEVVSNIEYTEEIVDEYTYNYITDILSKISRQLRQIDAKFDNARITDEYARYPMIRLGIDSPYFGLASITDSRLNVKNSVSTLDMAKGYGIRSIVNTKTVLVQDIGVSDFVLSTRKVTISKDMTNKDALLVLEKLIEYLQQARNINEFAEIQISNIFSDYISEDKNLKIRYIKSEIETTNNMLFETQEMLTQIDLITMLDLTENYSKYEEFVNKVKEIKELVNSISTSDEELETCITDIISLKSEISEFKKEIEEKYSYDIVIDTVLQNTLIKMNSYMSFVYDLVDIDREKFESDEDDFSPVLGRYISSLEKYRDEISSVIAEGKYANQELDMTKDQTVEEMEKIYDIYLKFLNSLNVFLNQYIRINVTDIKGNGFLAYELSDELIYVYLDLDIDLLNISQLLNRDNMYSNITAINSLKEVAEKTKKAKVLIEGKNIS